MPVDKKRALFETIETRDSVCRNSRRGGGEDTKMSQKGKKAILTMKSLILAQDER